MRNNKLNSEDLKKQNEEKYFKIFLTDTNLDIKVLSFKSGNHLNSEPDIICEFTDGSIVGYELTECMNQELRHDLAKHSSTSEIAPSGGGIGNIRRVVTQKLSKNYTTDFPIELVVYFDQIGFINFSGAKYELLNQGGFERGQFDRIWLMFVGEETGLIYERSTNNHT
jgi:hypothetical protein